jgi:hypothetical protein
MIVSGFVPQGLAYYRYGNSVLFVEPSQLASEQFQPSVEFDITGQLHMVWSDNRDIVRHIYHRQMSRNGSFDPSGRADMEGECATFECNLDLPEIVFTLSNNTGYMACYGTYGSPFIAASQYDMTPIPLWTQVTSPDNSTPIGQHLSMDTYGIHVFLAYEYGNGIRLNRYTDVGWDSPYTLSPAAGITYSNPDIATDSIGFVYLVVDEFDSSLGIHRVLAARSNSTDSVSGFNSFREVDTPDTLGIEANPAISVTGIAPSNVYVAIGYIGVFNGDGMVYCRYEHNGGWSGGTPMIGNKSQACSWTSGAGMSPENPDITFARNHEIHMTWQDSRLGQSEIFAAVSYNQAVFFLHDQRISIDAFGTSPATYPRLAQFPLDNDIVIAYQRRDTSGLSHVFATLDLAAFYDQCDDPSFLNWTSHNGVDVDTFGLNGLSFRLHSSTIKGQLIEDYGSNHMVGSVEFWFYDSLSEDPDFYMSMHGDDGVKSGVYRMVGISNATTKSDYSVYDGTSWQDLASHPRTNDWHHVVVLVQSESPGIMIYLDPEIDPVPVHASPNFVWFDQVIFQGGTDTDPYFVDDIRIVAEAEINLPALTLPGSLLLLMAFAALLITRRRLTKN